MFDLDRAVEHVKVDTEHWGFETDLILDGLCLCGEIGELANVIKKLNRPEHLRGKATDVLLAELREELIDVLIYTCKIIGATGMDITEEWEKKDAILHKRWG